MEQKEKIFNDVKRIIIAGAKSQPRSVLQTFRSFVNRWEIAQIRKNKDKNYNIDHKLLALILVIQNNWPELFLRIVYYPEHLFYIYALVKDKPLNNYCTLVELDEINSLGVVTNEKAAAYSYSVRYQREIVRLFDAFEDDDLNKMDIDHIVLHITLVNGQSIGFSPISDHILDILLSGDPVRIHHLQRQNAKNTLGSIFDRHALRRTMLQLGRLEEIRQQKNVDSDQESVLSQIERLLVAWGLLEETKTIYRLEELVLKNTALPLKLRMRCLYTFIHHANRGDQQAAKILLGVLNNSQYNLVLREKIAHMLRYINMNDDRLLEIVEIFEQFSLWDRPIQETLLESLVQAYEYELDDQDFASWGHKVVEKINLANIKWENLIEILKKINSTDNFWSINKYGSYLREQIRKNSGKNQFGMVADYFSLLKEKMALKEFSSDIEKEVISEFVEIIPFAEPKNQEEILREALEVQYGLQRSSQKDEWQDVWYHISSYLSEFNKAFQQQEDSHREWTEFLRGLRTIIVYSPRAVTFIRHLYEISPEGWKADFGSILISISNGEILEQAVMKELMKKLASDACEDFALI